MTRFCGKIGYAETAAEDSARAGVYEEKIIERLYYGDETRTTRQLRSDEKVNNNVIANISISVVADAYAEDSFMHIRYVWWRGKPWLVDDVTVQDHRLIFSMGGLYNGPTADSP